MEHLERRKRMEQKEHKKLHAEWYELMSGSKDQSKEIDYWVKCIEQAGEPALELGSGTGRVLIPLLEQGLDVIGIDTSSDMTARCLAACKQKNLKPEIHDQSMLEFDLSREFGLIFMASGGLGLFTEDEFIHTTFERVMAHLKPGGVFIYEFESVPDPYEDNDNWTGDWICGSNDVIIAWRWHWKHDPVTNIWQGLFVVEKFVEGCLVETEANERWGRTFDLDDALQYARAAGFEDIKAANWLTDDPPDKNSDVVTVRCRRPL